jgi:integrase
MAGVGGVRKSMTQSPTAAESQFAMDKIFSTWNDYVEGRPKSTIVAYQTPWRDLQRFTKTKRITDPGVVTPKDMTDFVEDMKERGLAVGTINERLTKIRSIYKVAKGKHKLATNPAADTLGVKESSVRQRRKRRLSFGERDLELIFGSAIFTEQKRSKGQSREASYWIPLVMYYSGARPEEVAGLALNDVCQDRTLGWYFNIIDRPTDEDWDLFDEEEVPESHRRTLKNATSVRRIPIAQQLIDLGLLRYIEWVRGQGATVLFPTLKKDWHEKLPSLTS